MRIYIPEPFFDFKILYFFVIVSLLCGKVRDEAKWYKA